MVTSNKIRGNLVNAYSCCISVRKPVCTSILGPLGEVATQGHPWLNIEFSVNLGYMSLSQKNNKKGRPMLDSEGGHRLTAEAALGSP